MMSNIEKNLLNDLKTNLKLDMEINENDRKMVLKCDNKCRLLSHLFHKAGLVKLHVTLPEREFEIVFNSPYSRGEIFDAIYEINKNSPIWIVEFIEKYIENDFMMRQAFIGAEEAPI